jgi:D-hydroxyproline dehydrogenase subunit gamma
VKIDSNFQQIDKHLNLVEVEFAGQKLNLPLGANLAASLLVAGIDIFRYTPVSESPRGPFCMMGACFDCLVDIDGVHRQACLLNVTPNLTIKQINKQSCGFND